MAKLVDVEGIGEKYAQKLKEAGVSSTRALLDKGAKSKGRKERQVRREERFVRGCSHGRNHAAENR